MHQHFVSSVPSHAQWWETQRGNQAVLSLTYRWYPRLNSSGAHLSIIQTPQLLSDVFIWLVTCQRALYWGSWSIEFAFVLDLRDKYGFEAKGPSECKCTRIHLDKNTNVQEYKWICLLCYNLILPWNSLNNLFKDWIDSYSLWAEYQPNPAERKSSS